MEKMLWSPYKKYFISCLVVTQNIALSLKPEKLNKEMKLHHT